MWLSFIFIEFTKIILFKYCVNMENCESFKDFSFIYIIYIYIDRWWMLHPNFSYNTIEILLLFIAHYGRNLKPNLCQSWKKCTFITPTIISVYEWIWIWVLRIDLELYVQFWEKLWAFCILHCKFNVFFWQPFGFMLCLTCILFCFCRFNVLT